MKPIIPISQFDKQGGMTTFQQVTPLMNACALPLCWSTTLLQMSIQSCVLCDRNYPLHTLVQFKCTGIELIISTFLCNQFFVTSTLNDPAMVEYHNHIGILDCG